MNDRGGPDHSENEVLSKFPDLARARNLYISLLTKDSSALVNLGYTGAKLIKAKNVLSLLIEAGEINDHITDNPYLSIKSPTLGWAQGLEIYHLPSKQGFYLDRNYFLRLLNILLISETSPASLSIVFNLFLSRKMLKKR